MKKKLLFIILLFSILLYSCGGSAKYNVVDSSTYAHSQRKEFKPGKRIVIVSAYIELSVSDVNKVTPLIIDLAKKFKGYTVSSSENYVSIRVETAYFNKAIKKIESLGEVVERNVNGRDVTDQFYDISIRLDNALKSRDRYLELLKKAENVQAALAVEKELERLNGVIERLKGGKQSIIDQVQYSLINVSVEKEVTPGPIGWIFYSLYKGIYWLFVWD